jgi:hypothetical protein
VLSKSKCHIPALYFKNYLAWYSEKRRVIVFRKSNLKEMYEIGIVIFLKEDSP